MAKNKRTKTKTKTKDSGRDANAEWLQANKAWNWQWPDEKNRWFTNLKPVTAAPETRFTSTGPSKRTKAKRAARKRKGRRSGRSSYDTAVARVAAARRS
jgi:hypothetical protein